MSWDLLVSLCRICLYSCLWISMTCITCFDNHLWISVWLYRSCPNDISRFLCPALLDMSLQSALDPSVLIKWHVSFFWFPGHVFTTIYGSLFSTLEDVFNCLWMHLSYLTRHVNKAISRSPCQVQKISRSLCLTWQDIFPQPSLDPFGQDSIFKQWSIVSVLLYRTCLTSHI